MLLSPLINACENYFCEKIIFLEKLSPSDKNLIFDSSEQNWQPTVIRSLPLLKSHSVGQVAFRYPRIFQNKTRICIPIMLTSAEFNICQTKRFQAHLVEKAIFGLVVNHIGSTHIPPIKVVLIHVLSFSRRSNFFKFSISEVLDFQIQLPGKSQR